MDFHMNQTQTKWELESICVLPVSSAYMCVCAETDASWIV